VRTGKEIRKAATVTALTKLHHEARKIRADQLYPGVITSEDIND
jgi:hypothetical protein